MLVDGTTDAFGRRWFEGSPLPGYVRPDHARAHRYRRPGGLALRPRGGRRLRHAEQDAALRHPDARRPGASGAGAPRAGATRALRGRPGGGHHPEAPAVVTVAERGPNIEILHLLDKLEALVSGGTRLPLTSRALVDEQEFVDLLDGIRAALPEEGRPAKRGS